MPIMVKNEYDIVRILGQKKVYTPFIRTDRILMKGVFLYEYG